jgi:hypothetical protein
MPLPFLASLGITAVGAATSMYGGAAEDSARNKATRIAFKSAMDQWRYTNQQGKRDYNFAVRGVNIARQNEAAERGWRDQTALLDYQHGMAIRDYEYGMQMRAYNKSEETYKKQLNFNNMAAQVALESEDRWLDERFKETAFANQDLIVQLLQEEGKASLVQSGRSAGKAVQSVLAQAGRNQAILVESLTSAQKQSAVNRKKIQTDKYGADLMADANRMLKPEIAPALPKPIPLPQSIFQNPQKWKNTPRPRMGAMTNSGFTSAALSSGSDLFSTVMNGIKWG